MESGGWSVDGRQRDRAVAEIWRGGLSSSCWRLGSDGVAVRWRQLLEMTGGDFSRRQLEQLSSPGGDWRRRRRSGGSRRRRRRLLRRCRRFPPRRRLLFSFLGISGWI
ncbi:hypothetical protein CASFOL_008352 [Castilleja foliolosa]|uniref:Uncharacterized protein n=1 Tax=Castilleja foliolosa TaxID=1961234 RepID=A0ABD3DZR4_9LAMI